TIQGDFRFAAGAADDPPFGALGLNDQTDNASYHNHFLTFFYMNNSNAATLYGSNDGSGTYGSTDHPAGDTTSLAMGSWFTLQAELNFVTGTVRERYAPMGGAFGPYTSSLPIGFFATTDGVQLRIGTYNTLDMDNLSVTPEPASASMLSL